MTLVKEKWATEKIDFLTEIGITQKCAWLRMLVDSVDTVRQDR